MNTTPDVASLFLYNQSITSLLDQGVIVTAILPTAPLGLLANLLIIWTIWRTKAIHNKGHFIILSYTTADAVFGLTMIIWEIRAIVRIRQLNPMVAPSWLCVLNYQQINIIAQSAIVLSAVLALDRFMCVATPIFYKKLDTRRYILIVNLAAYSYVITMAFIGMIGTDIHLMWNCENASFQLNTVGQWQYGKLATIAAVIIGVLYVSAAGILAYRYKKSRLTGASQKAEWKQRWEVQVFASMSIVGLIAVVMRTIQGFSFNFAQQRFAGMIVSFEILIALGVVAKFVEAVLHLLIYLAIDGGFRTGFKKNVVSKILGRNNVQQMTRSNSGGGGKRMP